MTNFSKFHSTNVLMPSCIAVVNQNHPDLSTVFNRNLINAISHSTAEGTSPALMPPALVPTTGDLGTGDWPVVPDGKCYRDAALSWYSFGLKVIPISPGTKVTALKWDPWLDSLAPWKIINFWSSHPDHEVGFIVSNEVVVFDADSIESIAALEALETQFKMAPTLVVATRKGVHHYFGVAAGTTVKSDAHCTQKHPERIDVKARRGMVILPPSPGKTVQFCSVQSASELSLASQDFIDAIAVHNGRKPPREAVPVPTKPNTSGCFALRVTVPRSMISQSSVVIPLLIAATDRINPDCGYNDWFAVGAAIYNETDGGEEGFDVFDTWSAKGEKYKGVSETRKKWQSIKPDHPNPAWIGSLKKLVEANGHTWEDVLKAAEPFEVVEADEQEVA